jgi:hypothetical protein
MIVDGGKELDGRKGAIGDQHDGSIGKPAVDVQNDLLGSTEKCLGSSGFAGVEPFGGSKDRQKGQRHDPIGPWNLDE